MLVVLFALSNGVAVGRAVTTDNEWPWVSRDDLMFLAAFILSNDLQGHECISRVACLHPILARQLATAADFLSP